MRSQFRARHAGLGNHEIVIGKLLNLIGRDLKSVMPWAHGEQIRFAEHRGRLTQQLNAVAVVRVLRNNSGRMKHNRDSLPQSVDLRSKTYKPLEVVVTQQTKRLGLYLKRGDLPE
jgi:hypothetical protein